MDEQCFGRDVAPAQIENQINFIEQQIKWKWTYHDCRKKSNNYREGLCEANRNSTQP